MQTLLALGLLLAQSDFSEAERKLGETLLKDGYSGSRVVMPDEVISYLKTLVEKTPGAAQIRFEFVSASDAQPRPLPGGIIMMPFELLTRNEWDFVTSLATAMGHATMRHGLREPRGPGGPKVYLPKFTPSELAAAREFGRETANRVGVQKGVESLEFLKVQKALSGYRPR